MADMFPVHDLPHTIALFPLPGALLLPRARLPLQLFEPRYLQMLDDALKTGHRMIGMVQPIEGAPNDTHVNLHAVGCAGRVTQFAETGDGRYMITLTGISRFRITSEVPGFTPYIRAEVDWSDFRPDLAEEEHDPALNRDRFVDLLKRYFDVAQLSTDWDSLEDADDELLVNSLSMLCPFDPEERQALLEAPTLSERREMLETLMEFALRTGKSEDRLQ